MQDLIDQLFIEQTCDEKSTYVFNDNLPLSFATEQEAAAFLVEAIRAWRPKGLFVFRAIDSETGRIAKDPGNLPEDQLVLRFRYFRGKPDDAEMVSSITSQERILPNLRQLSFVREDVICPCGCGHIVYLISLSMLKFFAAEGHAGLERKEKEKEDARERAILEHRTAELDKKLAGRVISPELRTQLLDFTGHDFSIVNENVACVIDSRHHYPSGAGGAYYSQVHCLFGSKKRTQEWQWRDAYSHTADKRWLSVHGIGTVLMKEEGGNVTFTVELLNRDHGSRSTTFTFQGDTAGVLSPTP